MTERKTKQFFEKIHIQMLQAFNENLDGLSLIELKEKTGLDFLGRGNIEVLIIKGLVQRSDKVRKGNLEKIDGTKYYRRKIYGVYEITDDGKKWLNEHSR